MDFVTTINDRDTWFFRSSTWFNQIHVDGLSGNDGAIFLNGQNLFIQLSSNTNTLSAIQGLSGNWESTFSIVQANSALWEESQDISQLSASVIEIGSVSANWNSAYTTVQTNSSTTWLGDSAVDSLVHNTSSSWNIAYTNLTSNSAAYLSSVDISLLIATSANWDSVYTTVQTNSSIIWNYQGTDIKELSANWQLAYTNLISNSAAYLSSIDISLISTTSGSWDSVFTTVQLNSTTTWLGDSAVDSIVRSNSGNWNSAYINISNYAPLSGATFTNPITTSAINIDGHLGYTHSKKIILMDEDGNSYEFYLRGGILTIS